MTFSHINVNYRKIFLLFSIGILCLGIGTVYAADPNGEPNKPPVPATIIDTTKLPVESMPEVEPPADPEALRPAGTPRPLHTQGNQICLPDGTPIKLYGVNIASLEWSDEGENIIQSLDVAISTWGSSLVRIPLSQDRWFGRSSTQEDGGKKYRAIVDQLVTFASKHGTYIWLELHWNNLGLWGRYIGQHYMPDVCSVQFWQSIAQRYANHPAVLFGVYNEPQEVTWDVWLHGGAVEEKIRPDRLQGVPASPSPENLIIRYKAVGQQELYDTVRAAGTTDNIVIISGMDWGYDLREAVDKYEVKGHNIVYDTHCYPWKAWSPDRNWDLSFGNPSKKVPVIVGEWGSYEGSDGHRKYLDTMLEYLRKHDLSWTAWDFHPEAGPKLIKNWEYEPTEFGKIVQEELKRNKQ